MFGGLRSTISGVCCLILLCSVTAYADTHWVNSAGSNTPPYTTYVTGAHYLQDAVAAASEGDIIRVATGEYDVDTTIYIPSGVIWAGASRDSVVIRWIDPVYRPGRLAELGGNNEVYGIEFDYSSPANHSAINGLFLPIGNSNLKIYGCRFRDLQVFSNGSGEQEVFNNEFYFYATGIYFKGASVWIHHNSFSGTGITGGNGVKCVLAGNVLVEHNVFAGVGGARPNGVYIYHATFIEVRNNLFINSKDPVSWWYASGVVENNTMIHAVGIPGGSEPHNGISVFLRSYETVTIRNNVMWDFTAPWEFGAECPTCDTTGLITFVHNVFWPPKDIHYQRWPDDPPELIKLLDSANFEAYPMFTGDSIYQLQAGSPLIDTGDPAVLDADGSRSDLGWTGGPGGYTYEYPQLAPRPPDSVWVESNDNSAMVTWMARHESDLAEYQLYRDSHSGFPIGVENLIAQIGAGDTAFIDPVDGLGSELYYVVTAVDTAGLESDPSPEAALFITGILEDPDVPPLPLTPDIRGVYPNPFNASTVIEIFIPAVGASPTQVQLVIYDALGRKVASLINEKQNPGTHRVSWNGRNDTGDPVASGVYFVRLEIWGYKFESSVKIVLQK